MSFDPQKVGAPILAKVIQMLEAEGIVVGHLLIAYDGGEGNGHGADPSYVLGSHFWPQIEEHRKCHTFLTQTALRAVGPEMRDDSTGYMTSYFPDGSVLVIAASMGQFQTGDGGDVHDS